MEVVNYQKILGRNMYVHTVQSEKKTKIDTGPIALQAMETRLT